MIGFKTRIATHLPAVLVLLTFFAFFTGCSQKEIKDIRIGVILPLTGSHAKYGTWIKEGMDIALNEINSERSHVSLNLLYEDDFGTAQGGVNAVHKLIHGDHVSAITGILLSQVALAIAPIVEQEKVPLLIVGAGAEKIRESGDYVFRIREPATLHAQRAAQYVLSLTKISAVIFVNAENGVSYAEAFRAFYIDGGGELALWERYDEGETEFRPHLQKLQTTGAEVVYVPGFVREIAHILRQAREIGIEVQFVSTVGAEHPSLLELAGNAAEGLVYTYPFDPSLVPGGSVAQRFLVQFREKYGRDPDFLAANGYDAIRLLAHIVSKYGSDANSIKDALYRIHDYDGAGGTFSFDDLGEVKKPVLLKHVENGQFRFLSQ
ncbi:MAG: ABC transporter substrate-binding protein [Desulfatiglandales bacterium]